MNIVTRIIEDDKGFCMDDLINIFGKDKDESAVLTWKYKDESGEEKERTERCFYMDNNRSEVSVFYVERNDRRFDKVFTNIDISQIKEINFVRLSIVQKSFEQIFCQKLESQLKRIAIETFMSNWYTWLLNWEVNNNRRGGKAFIEASKWILISEINDYGHSFVTNITNCNLRKYHEWRNKFVEVIDFNNKTHSEHSEIIGFIHNKLHNRCSK